MSRLSPPQSPPFVDTPTKNQSSPKMNSHLPQTPQSPPFPFAASLPADNDVNMTGTSGIEMQTSNSNELSAAEASNKRKRENDDDGGQEQKKVHIENGTPGIEALHRDVGPFYRLASTPYPKAKIDLTADLFKVYGLEDIAKDVARGGENPKKMGKTYKKHMRLMKLSGKFDAVKKREDEMGLFDMLQIPDDEWNQTETLGKDMNPGKSGLSDAARSSLAQAMTMSKGRIPRDRWDPSVLALETVAPSAATARPASVVGSNRKILGQGPNAAPAPVRQTKAAVEQTRPQRNIRKRTYTDDGFEGYGEGYADDNMADEGAFIPGDEDRQQRRKKDSSVYHFPPANNTTMRHGYGPGTVGA